MTRIVNLTPHQITVRWWLPDGKLTDRELEPSGTIARATEIQMAAEPIDGIPTSYATYGAVDGLPPPSTEVYYVVSALAAQAAYSAGRSTSDLLVPGGQYRDFSGRIAGCTSLTRWRPL